MKEIFPFKRYFFLLILVALINGLVVAQTNAEESPGETVQMPVNTDWRLDVNRTVVKINRWKWVLRYVERRSDTLIVGIVARNNASTNRPLFLESGFKSKIILLDERTQQDYPLLEVSGVSEAFTPVKRKTSKETKFVFQYPEGAESVQFSSEWLTALMGGAATWMEVKFPIVLQPLESGK